MYRSNAVTYTKGPYLLEPRLGHGSGGPRWVICAPLFEDKSKPDYENRIAVVSVNGAPHGDQNIALDNANLLAASTDLLDVAETYLRMSDTILSKETIDVEELKIALEFYKPHLVEALKKAKGQI
jgi:hypothetical protein